MALSVIIDVGNSSIGAALITTSLPFKAGSQPEGAAAAETKTPPRATLLASRRLFLPLGLELAQADQLQQSLISTMRDLVDAIAVDVQAAITHKMASRLDRVHVVLSSPWIDVLPHVETIERAVPFTVTERMVNQVLGDYLKKYLKTQPSVAVCDSRVTSVLLNGYEVSDPFGMSTHKVTLGAVLTVMPGALRAQLESLIARRLHAKKMEFHAFSIVAFDSLRDMFPHQSEWIFGDITGEVTDLLYIHHGVITSASSIPYGWHTVVRAVAQKMHTTPDVARSLICMAVRDNAHDKTSEKIRMVLEPLLQQWAHAVAPAHAEMAHTTHLPTYITSDDDFGALYQTALKALVSGSSVTVIDKEHIQPFIALGPGARYDTFISLAALSLTKTYNE